MCCMQRYDSTGVLVYLVMRLASMVALHWKNGMTGALHFASK